MSVKLGDKIRLVIIENDIKGFSRVLDHMRFRLGMSYEQIRDRFKEKGMSHDDFEEWSERADELDSNP